MKLFHGYEECYFDNVNNVNDKVNRIEDRL